MESYFALVRKLFPPEVQWSLVIPRHESRGIWRRVHSVFEARRRQGDINHITGDIHYVAILLRKRRTVLTIHDCGFEQTAFGIKRIMLRWFWFRIPARRVAIITTVSHYSRDRILANTACDPAKIQVVHACISPAFKPIAREFHSDQPVILAVGTPPNKNLERLCAALDGLNCRLHVIGRLSQKQRAGLANLDYCNSYDLSEEELVRAYGESDLIAFVSTYEGFGLPILEANAVGRPVVTSSVTSMPEVAGDAAYLVDPFSVDSIRKGIVEVIGSSELRSELVKRGFANVRRFAPLEISRQYLKIYGDLMDSRKSASVDAANK